MSVERHDGPAALRSGSRRRRQHAHAHGQGGARSITGSRSCAGRSSCCRRSVRRLSFPCGRISATMPRAPAMPQIVDRQPGIGPIAGISAALAGASESSVAGARVRLAVPHRANVAAPDRTPRSAQGRDRLSQRARQLARAALRDLGARGTRAGARVHRERQAVPAQVPDQFGHRAARSARASGTRQREHGGRVRLGDGGAASLSTPSRRRVGEDRSHSVLRDPARASRAQRGNARHELPARRPSCTRSCGSVIRSNWRRRN